jgi:hypothetical protein
LVQKSIASTPNGHLQILFSGFSKPRHQIKKQILTPPNRITPLPPYCNAKKVLWFLFGKGQKREQPSFFGGPI